MEAIERPLVNYPKENKNAGDKSNSQAKNIYECVTFMAKEIAERGLQVILKHTVDLKCSLGLVNAKGNNRASSNHLNQLYFHYVLIAPFNNEHRYVRLGHTMGFFAGIWLLP